MKRKLYTKQHSAEVLAKIGGDGPFTAEEHALASERDLAGRFASRDSLIRSYLASNARKLAAAGFLIQLMGERGHRSVLSLGAGQCVLEQLLKSALPVETRVAATDFDSFLVENAKRLFPELATARFDFFKDDLGRLVDALGGRFDVAVFFGSTYVMDDADFIRLLEGLRKSGVREVVDFYAGYMNWRAYLSFLPVLSTLRSSPALRRLLGKEPDDRDASGKFHGYTRSRGELRRLYARAGFRIVQETAVPPYEYVAVLRPQLV